MRFIVPLAFLLTAAALGVMASHFAGAGDEDNPAISGGLATDNRALLSICVEGAGGKAVKPGEVNSVQQALDNSLGPALEGFERPPYPETGAVEVGCPAASVPVGTPMTPYESQEYAASVQVPADPSGYRVFVYLVPEDLYAATFPGEPYVRTTAELLCEEHVCAEVTTALYLPESASAQTLEVGLVDALGLISREDPPMNPTEVEERRRREAAPSQ